MGLEDHVFKAEPSLAVCNWNECKERGDYRRCYFNNLSVTCPNYLEHHNYLKVIRRLIIGRRSRK